MNASGCFWFYVLDPQRKRFKLPLTRTFFQSRSSDMAKVGSYVPPELPMPPNHTHPNGAIDSVNNYHIDDKFSGPGCRTSGSTGNPKWASDSNSIYNPDGTTVQPPAVLMETYMRCI